MKTLNLFLASSNDLKEERDAIDLMIAKENEHLEKDSIRLKVVRWEDMLQSCQPTSFQDSINEQLYSCDIFVVIFGRRIGKFTLEEFEIAYDRLKNNQKPNYLFVFFKTGIVMDDQCEEDYVEVIQFKKKIKLYEQIYKTYDTIDSLKLNLKEQLNLITPCFIENSPSSTDCPPAQHALSDHAVEKFRESYLYRVFNDAGQLSLSGIDPKASSVEKSQKINLSSIYTALLTYHTDRDMKFSEDKTGHYEKKSALEMLNTQKQLVLLGDPGSGKTTFVNFVALCLAGEALNDSQVNLALLTKPLPEKDSNQDWNHKALLPVRIILRDFVARGLPKSDEPATAKHLWDFFEDELTKDHLGDYAPYLKQELQTSGGMILLDGLDEVPEADSRRTQIKQVVEDFMVVFHRCRILVTSRTYAYQNQDFKIKGLTEAILAPFSNAQIEMFVERWYAHIAQIRNMDKNDAAGRSVLLKRAISNNKRLQVLAERPLLLTLMASLHAWRGGSLPEQREELYSSAVDLLLDWWERPRIVMDDQGKPIVLQPSLMEWLKVDRKKIRGLLNQLAYEAHKNQPDLVGTADVAQADLVAGMLKIADLDLNPKNLVDYLRDRAGILLARGDKVYTFPHRTFQEYLAACYLTDDNFPEHVSSLAKSDLNRWREVTLLAAAKAVRGSESAVWTLSEELCLKEVESCEPSMERINGAYLAAQALEENARLEGLSERNQIKLDRVKNWLIYIIRGNQLSALERSNAGNLLAQLGDPRKEVMTIAHMKFCFVPAGEFLMGSDKNEDSDAVRYEMPQHIVELSSYYISRYPVTQAQYQLFIDDGGYNNPDFWIEAIEDREWKDGNISGRERPDLKGEPFDLPNHPVVNVSWYEAIAFTRWLTVKYRELNLLSSDEIIRLPTEAEWEKASRGGMQHPEKSCIVIAPGLKNDSTAIQMIKNKMASRKYPWGTTIDKEQCNYDATGINATSTVGCFVSGASVYECEEMSGNVWEWCMDWYGDYSKNVDNNSKGPMTGSDRVIRGGGWSNIAGLCRSAGRDWLGPGVAYDILGFRLCAPGR
jgi:formylglycine-generating enzyme required for sulfatase activity